MRYEQGHASADLSVAGVLVHQFDDTEDGDKPWLPCPPNRWCRDIADRISASLISRKLPYLFKEGGAGMILTPATAKIRCSYFADGGTLPKRCRRDSPPGCVPGCCDTKGNPDWCADVRSESQTVYQCAFWPKDLGAMLRHHEMRPGSYNEVMVDPSNWGAATTQAFYFVKQKGRPLMTPERRQEVAGFEAMARSAHRRFHATYRHAVIAPLVQLELEPENGHPPFTRIA